MGIHGMDLIGVGDGILGMVLAGDGIHGMDLDGDGMVGMALVGGYYGNGWGYYGIWECNVSYNHGRRGGMDTIMVEVAELQIDLNTTRPNFDTRNNTPRSQTLAKISKYNSKIPKRYT